MTHTTRIHRWLAGSGLALIALGGLGCSGDSTTHAAVDDLDSNWSCTTESGVAKARGSVTNHSSEPSFYIVTVDFRAEGRRFESTAHSRDGVAPGETADIEVAVADAPAGDVECAVRDIERFKA